jgi:hypothetical protein
MASSDRRRGDGRVARSVVVAVLALAACASPALYTASTPPTVLTTSAAAGVHDMRGAYREAFCRRLAPTGRPCEDVLLRLSGERAPATASIPIPMAELARRYRVVFVAGFMAECVSPIITPFSDVVEALKADGVEARFLTTGGRGTATENAAQLARQLDALPDDPRPFIVVGYSKGLADVLELAVSHPAVAARIAAVVSVAGAANGSPLADQFHEAYRLLVARMPLIVCARGTGDEIDDLRRDVRLEWWRRHGPALAVPIFALVTTPRPERISPLIWPVYRMLARVEPRNDGHVIWYDQIPPGARLLGFLDADHFTVATPYATELPLASLVFHDAVPRPLVIQAALEVVDAFLQGPGALDGRPGHGGWREGSSCEAPPEDRARGVLSVR